MVVTFGVDDVTPAAAPLPSGPLRDLFPDAFAIGGDPDLPVLEPDGVHPFLGAIGRAFADHRSIVLSPDAVWLTIAQGVAQHIRLNAEQLRPLLVEHTGRKTLTAAVFGPMPRDAAFWQDLIEDFHKQVGGAGFFECDFSTSTSVERVAGQVVLLDAYSPYFSYWLVCVCGIPSITLTGTVEDWTRIRARVDEIERFGLDKWCRSLAPIMDQFVRAASGDVDVEFWRRIYNPVDAYGGDVITGWAARFYPYLEGGGALNAPNPLLDLPIGEPRGSVEGITSDDVPATLSRAVVNVADGVAGDLRAVAVHAGLVAVAQDPDGSLRPVAGWHVAPATAEIDDVIDRIISEHEPEPPGPMDDVEGCADVVALYRRLGAATLFGGKVRILPVSEHRLVREGHFVGIIDLADGRSVCADNDYSTGTTTWLLGRIEEVPDRHDGLGPYYRFAGEPVSMGATTLAMLLTSALDRRGAIGADPEQGEDGDHGQQ